MSLTLLLENNRASTQVEVKKFDLNLTPSFQVNIDESNGYNYYLNTSPSANQTQFVLPIVPRIPSKTRLYINGVKYVFGNHFNINSNILNWLFSMHIETTDIIEIEYI